MTALCYFTEHADKVQIPAVGRVSIVWEMLGDFAVNNARDEHSLVDVMIVGRLHGDIFCPRLQFII